MNTTKPLLVLLVAAAFAAPAFAQNLPAKTEDGLEWRQVPGVDVAYVRPGADVSEYTRVRLGPVSVSFRKNFARDAAPPNKRVSEADLQGIRERLGGLLVEEVTRELAAGGYEITQASGHDVMQLDLSVNDLTMAMVPQRQGPDDVLAYSTGEMLLEAEVRDSVTGEIEARIFEVAEGRVTHQLHRITRGENQREARQIAEAWAKLIREKLDAARAKTADR